MLAIAIITAIMFIMLSALPAQTTKEQSRLLGMKLPPDPNEIPEPEVVELRYGEKEKYLRELSLFAATGKRGALMEKFATITTTSASGALLPSELGWIDPPAANCFRAAHEIYGVKPVTSPRTNVVKIPVINALEGGPAPEDASAEVENNPNVAESFEMKPSGFQSGFLWISEIISRQSADIETPIQSQLVYVKETALEKAIAEAIVADAEITQIVTTATTTGFTYQNLLNLTRAVPKRYKAQRAIVLSTDAMDAAESLTDDAGRPVLDRYAKNPEIAFFKGLPVFECESGFEDFGVDKTIGCLFSLFGFRLYDAGPTTLVRVNARAERPGQVGLNVVSENAWGYATSGMALLKTAAS